MSINLESYTILSSLALVFVGSLTFYISSLISGHDIYKEANELEATFLLTIAGSVVFLLSPISFIILLSGSENYSRNLVQILDPNIIGLFLATALGLGLIFGYLTVMDLRLMFLCWFRKISGILFWIDTYATVWDDFFNSIKKGAEILVEKIDEAGNKNEMKCFFIECSIRDQEKELIVEFDNKRILILKDEIMRVTAPIYSFRKHFESVDHAGQSFYLLMMSIGFFILSFVSQTMEKYTHNDIKSFTLIYDLIMKINASSDTISNFYSILSKYFFITSIILLIISAYLAKKDFHDIRAYIMFCPDFVFVFLILAPSFYFIHFGANFPYITIFTIIAILTCPLIIIKLHINKELQTIIYKFDNDKSLEKIVNEFYLYYPLNEESSIDKIIKEGKIFEDMNPDEKKLADKLSKEIGNMKNRTQYLKNEDINILLKFKKILGQRNK